MLLLPRMATGIASAGASGTGNPPAASTSSMVGIMRRGDGPAEQVATGPAAPRARRPSSGLVCAAATSKGHRHHGLELEQVGDVVDKGQGLAGVHEADRRRVAGGQHRGLGDAVEAGGGGS